MLVFPFHHPPDADTSLRKIAAEPCYTLVARIEPTGSGWSLPSGPAQEAGPWWAGPRWINSAKSGTPLSIRRCRFPGFRLRSTRAYLLPPAPATVSIRRAGNLPEPRLPRHATWPSGRNQDQAAFHTVRAACSSRISCTVRGTLALGRGPLRGAPRRSAPCRSAFSNEAAPRTGQGVDCPGASQTWGGDGWPGPCGSGCRSAVSSGRRRLCRPECRSGSFGTD